MTGPSSSAEPVRGLVSFMAMEHLPSIASFSGIAGLAAMVVAVALIGFFLRRLGSPGDRERSL
ncbi:MAG TPA: hypothetical protein VKB94_04310 [Rhizomicrobium sp.]|nr:hypothetical protein [Rhizomicrobium sp.]